MSLSRNVPLMTIHFWVAQQLTRSSKIKTSPKDLWLMWNKEPIAELSTAPTPPGWLSNNPHTTHITGINKPRPAAAFAPIEVNYFILFVKCSTTKIWDWIAFCSSACVWHFLLKSSVWYNFDHQTCEGEYNSLTHQAENLLHLRFHLLNNTLSSHEDFVSLTSQVSSYNTHICISTLIYHNACFLCDIMDITLLMNLRNTIWIIQAKLIITQFWFRTEEPLQGYLGNWYLEKSCLGRKSLGGKTVSM